MQNYRSTPEFGCQAPPRVATEALKVVFALTLDFGVLNPTGKCATPTKEDMDTFKKFVTAFLSVVKTISLAILYHDILMCEHPDMHQLRSIVISCLVNSPNGWYDVLDAQTIMESFGALMHTLRTLLMPDIPMY